MVIQTDILLFVLIASLLYKIVIVIGLFMSEYKSSSFIKNSPFSLSNIKLFFPFAIL